MLGGERGFTMLEMIVVLAVIGIMAASLAPMVINYLEEAKVTKADSDVKAIAQNIVALTKDVRHFPLFKDGTVTAGVPDIELLRGPGVDPLDTASGDKWLTTTKIDDLENHLVKNAPPTKKYNTTGRMAWKGPYLEKLTEDPWGNRYLVNIKNADPSSLPSKVVWVLSAGPNGTIETNPNPLADSGPVAGGDDIVVRVK